MEEKKSYLETGMFNDLELFQQDPVSKWGKMNFIQMLQHLSEFFDVSSEKMRFELVTPEEQLPKYKEFLLSEKQFRENTRAPLNIIGEEPAPARYLTSNEAISALKSSVNDFFAYFRENPAAKTLHPVFGFLNFNEWVQLHYKHVTHHFRQFGILSPLT